jgi:GntR family transcriptional regulator of vanillate catabolism
MKPPKSRAASSEAGIAGKVVPIKGTAGATRSQSVTDALREAILNGEFAPGEHIQEVPLSERLRVSRTPVRTALQSLAAAGMLEYSANRGYNVRRLRRGELLSIFDIRGVLEGLACRLVAEQGLGAADRALFEQALEDGDRILLEPRLGQRERDANRKVNVTIHEIIIRASGSRMIAEMIRMCHNVPMSSDRNIVWSNSRSLALRHDDHRRIFDAIMRREGFRAEQLMREHVHCVKVQMEQRLVDFPEVAAE